MDIGMVVSGILLLAAAVIVVWQRYESIPPERKTWGFHALTVLVVVLLAGAFGAERYADFAEEQAAQRALKSDILKELKTNRDVSYQWKVLLDRRFTGVPVFTASLYDSGAVSRVKPEALSKELAEVYKEVLDLNKRLRPYRSSSEAYDSIPETQRTKKSVKATSQKLSVVMNRLDPKEAVPADFPTTNQIIKMFKKEFDDGTISADFAT